MSSADFFADNPYLISGLLDLVTVVLAWLIAGPQRRMVLLAGMVTLPFSPLAALFDHEYWSPTRLGGWRPGIEDTIYTFVLGARAWFFASIAFRGQYRAEGSAAQFVRRAIPVTAGAFAAYGGLVALGVGIFLPALLVPMAVTVWVLLRKPELWPLSLCGAIGCIALYYAELHLWFAIWPQFSGWWTPDTPWSRSVLGVPLGDLGWTAVVGATHPTVLAVLLGVRWHTKPAST